MNYGYIYKTVNTLNNKFYIGQKKGIFNPSYFGSGIRLIRSLKKYGENKFKLEVIAYATSKEELNRLEKKFIAEYRKQFLSKYLYNIADGGDGGRTIEHHTEKTKKIIGQYSLKHKKECSCYFCKSRRKEKIIHRENCQCWPCKSKRGEKRNYGWLLQHKPYKLHKLNCQCASCRSRRTRKAQPRSRPEMGGFFLKLPCLKLKG